MLFIRIKVKVTIIPASTVLPNENETLLIQKNKKYIKVKNDYEILANFLVLFIL